MHFCLQECSATDILPDTTDSLFRFLEDQTNKEPPNSNSDTSTVATEDNEQEKAVACLVKIVHLIHLANLRNVHQVSIFLSVLLISIDTFEP